MAVKKLTRAQKFDAMYGQAGTYMSGLSHGARVELKRAAAKRGLTVAGTLQNVPEPLRERSTASLTAQALKTTNDAYAPAEQALSARQTQINALDAKRKTDNDYYSQWLATQQQNADAVSATADAALLTQASQLHGAAQTQGDAAQQAAMAQAGATPGNVSDPSQSTALQGLTANTDRSVGAADIANANAVGQVARSGAQRATLQASNFAQAAALEAHRQGDTYTALAKLSDDTAAEKLTKAADSSKEVARLLDNEVTKAQSNQQNEMLGAELNVKTDALSEKTAHDQATTKISKQNADTSRAAQQATARIQQINAQLRGQSLGETERHNLETEKAAQQRIAKMGTGSAGKFTAGQRTASRKQITSVNNAVSTIKQLQNETVGGKKLTSTQIRQQMGAPKGVNYPHGGHDPDITNAAYDILTYGYLTQANYDALKQAGVLIPKAWKPKGSGYAGPH